MRQAQGKGRDNALGSHAEEESRQEEGHDRHEERDFLARPDDLRGVPCLGYRDEALGDL